ncbi:MAG: peptide-methionine (R)-S-oxide reductase MsrB [Rhodoferax sp.]|nr:peptide-methionine (R)-S-oxide reductase MsrB [Rhodoferax sp.]
MPYKIEKTDDEWKALLKGKGAEAMAFDVTRHEATEHSFSGKYADHHGVGVYTCICCGKPLFASDTKYESGTGWPSYFQPINDGAVETKVDGMLWMKRTEVHCADCGSHLGHVFADGPEPTGQRFCMNSASLDFKPA